MPVIMDIGPSGQPPVTKYTYDLGVVTLSARAAVVYAPTELASAVRAIRVFRQAVWVNDPKVLVTLPEPPFNYRVHDGDPNMLDCQFRCANADPPPPNLTLDATIDMTTRAISFAARPERTIAWGDFLLFVSWLEFVLLLANR